MCHKLLDLGKQKHVEMCNTVAKRLDQYSNWIDDVGFIDEAHFYLNGAVSHYINVYSRDGEFEEVNEKCLKDLKKSLPCVY